MPIFSDRLKHAWSAFFGRDAPSYQELGPSYSRKPDKVRLSRGNSRSVVTAIYNRIAMDCASVGIHHVKLDNVGRFKEYIKSGLEECLTVEANLDQTGRAFLHDVYLSLLDEGCVAIVPTKTDIDPNISAGFDIQKLRVGKVKQWYPKHVRVELYDEDIGEFVERTYRKKFIALPENPFMAVMNEPNSTLQRLQNKLALLDLVDERTSSGRMDMVIQVPYSSKTEMQKKHAESRREALEKQLQESKYGIAWMDGTEKIVQLNRPIENNLLDQIDSLRSELYNQLGLTKAVFEGTANETEMLNYNNRTIEPIISAVVDEMKRKFLSKTARTQLQSIVFFREPFKLVPVTQIANIADVMTRNAILSANEFRAILGFRPSDGERANELINNNMPMQYIGGEPAVTPGDENGGATSPGEDTIADSGGASDETFPNIMDTPISELTDDGSLSHSAMLVERFLRKKNATWAREVEDNE